MLDVAGPLYEDAEVTNEPIAQRCGFDAPDIAASSLFTTLHCRPAGVSESLSFQSPAESGLGIKQAIRSSVMATITRLKSLAGVRIPDTPLAKAAVDLLEVTSPQFICNHCVRTYVFGNLAVGAAADVDDRKSCPL